MQIKVATFTPPQEKTTTISSDAPLHCEPTWQATLSLICVGGQYGSRLISAQHQGPLYVQKPFYPEGKDCVHIYPLHPPGGVVSGDDLRIQLHAESQASVLITTPGATRFYKSRYQNSQQLTNQSVINKIKITDNSCVEWLPMETIAFNGAHARSETQVTLDDSSGFMGWEVCCLGLPASHALFESGALSQRFDIYRQNKPLMIDRLNFSADSTLLSARAGLFGNTVYGTFACVPPLEHSLNDVQQSQALLGRIRKLLVKQALAGKFSITWMNKIYVARYLGNNAEEARAGFSGIWQLIRPALVGRQACPPRIWRT
jgi:urease accessory protein